MMDLRMWYVLMSKNVMLYRRSHRAIYLTISTSQLQQIGKMNEIQRFIFWLTFTSYLYISFVIPIRKKQIRIALQIQQAYLNKLTYRTKRKSNYYYQNVKNACFEKHMQFQTRKSIQETKASKIKAYTSTYNHVKYQSLKTWRCVKQQYIQLEILAQQLKNFFIKIAVNIRQIPQNIGRVKVAISKQQEFYQRAYTKSTESLNIPLINSFLKLNVFQNWCRSWSHVYLIKLTSQASMTKVSRNSSTQKLFQVAQIPHPIYFINAFSIRFLMFQLENVS
eukprot:TRINITY_DN16304_c2_g2_i1.p1 TRINITY_DN16304_c2_g2~~TRINITY_DN16304_c2_g2_i1.p1  ORF type:complete len:278 (+),score=-16.76 TRINITY_DN16304_c2_g2_i1:587-1420(+)